MDGIGFVPAAENDLKASAAKFRQHLTAYAAGRTVLKRILPSSDNGDCFKFSFSLGYGPKNSSAFSTV